jgi:hypothetical protein
MPLVFTGNPGVLECLACRVALERLDFRQLQEKILGNPRKVGRHLEFLKTFQFLLVDLRIVFLVHIERVFAASENFVHYYPRSPYVNTLCVFMIVGHYFWCHVDDCSTLFVETTLGTAIFGRETKINHFAGTQVRGIMNQDIV